MQPPKPRHSLTTWALYAGQQVLMHLALPLVLGVLVWRGFREPGHWRGLAQRFGFGPTGQPGAVWIYAASLGETRAASPLIRRLRQDGIPVILTHLSPAGLDEGWRLFRADDGITHRYMPMDLFWAVRLFLARAKPVVGIVMEIEIWPAMLFEARRQGIPMIMANGNLLQESMHNPGAARRHLLRLYREFAHVFTRTDAYRDRYIALGVTQDRISVVGEMKYDQWIDPAQPDLGRALRQRWAGVQRVLMIASSVRDEEALLHGMVANLLTRDPGLGVLWVPRSPQRFEAVATACADGPFATLRRSQLGADGSGTIPAGTRVIIGDSLGEMNVFYPMADLVFVGASLVDHGGHNIMEPMAFGKPVVMGPSIYGIAFAADPAAQAGAFESLPDAKALEARIAALLADPQTLDRMGMAARAFSDAQSGAAARTYQGLIPLIARLRH